MQLRNSTNNEEGVLSIEDDLELDERDRLEDELDESAAFVICWPKKRSRPSG
jgi:hypothetical protein